MIFFQKVCLKVTLHEHGSTRHRTNALLTVLLLLCSPNTFEYNIFLKYNTGGLHLVNCRYAISIVLSRHLRTSKEVVVD